MEVITMTKRKPSALDISDKIGISFSKEFTIEQLLNDWNELEQWIKKMIDETNDDMPRYTYEKVLFKMNEVKNR
jgi:benzoyl-CoA reductase/2-hydroxyglutaryl-CoA dehydratase subunit BcrC/BadD/HgdB